MMKNGVAASPYSITTSAAITISDLPDGRPAPEQPDPLRPSCPAQAECDRRRLGAREHVGQQVQRPRQESCRPYRLTAARRRWEAWSFPPFNEHRTMRAGAG